MNKQLLIDELHRDEGERLVAYLDSRGYWTIGVGHLIDPKMGGDPAPFGVDLRNGGRITPAQSVELLGRDIDTAVAELDRVLPWWRSLFEARQRVLINMMFNMGATKLLGFVNTLAAAKAGRYADAATGMLASRWADQVGKSAPCTAHPQGQRAWRLAQMMAQG